MSSLTPLSFPILSLDTQPKRIDMAYDARETIAPGASFSVLAKRVRVLFIAQESLQNTAKSALATLGFEMKTASEFDPEKARLFSPDVVFLEIHSEEEALFLVRKARVSARLWEAQIILLSSLEQGEHLSVRIGAQAHLKKPLQQKQVQASLATACARLRS